MIKLFEEYNDITDICEKYGIKNYTINSDGSIDVVEGYVYLENKHLDALPLKFGRVPFAFDCSNNQLTSLEGSPSNVGSFFCYSNKLTTLKGGPKEVAGDFYCDKNHLTSLEGCPEIVGGLFHITSNKLTTLKGAPKEIGGDFVCTGNPLPDIILKNYGHIKDILKFQDDYSIWNSDDTLNEYRFNDMMEEIKEMKGLKR